LWSVSNLGTHLVGPIHPIDADEEGSERLTGTCRRRDKRVVTVGDLSPTVGLGLSRAVRETALEPRADGRMEGLDHPATVSPASDGPVTGD
jgi:hypothetical protein